jgi:hypothetical protein
VRVKSNLVGGAVAALIASVLLSLPGSIASAASDGHQSEADGLTPGVQVTYRQVVPVNVVLIGYDDREIGAGLRSELSASSSPIVRAPLLFYGLQGRELGLQFNYQYKVIDAPRRFEDKFFRHLTEVGTRGPLTTFQQAYNDQLSNIRDVTGPVLTIDAPSTERYLERAARQELGLSRPDAYTVFMVNWFERSDFQFHVFRKTDEPDPDTGVNFGAKYSTQAMTAWGGTSGRSWFYDLSAGPEAWTNNWNVDDADLDGNGIADYRMPPVWEYTTGGDRARSALPSDLGKIVRYVAVNLLFTSSPSYDPLLTAPKPGGDKRVRVTMFEDNPAREGIELIDLRDSLRRWRQLEPYHSWRADLKDVNPIDPGSKRSLNIFAGLDLSDDCWNQYGDSFAQLFCYYDARRDQYLPPTGRDYVEGVFSFYTTDEALGSKAGLLGYADDNWVDGTQSYAFAFDTPTNVEHGFGFTTTTTHEVGHHLGLSHPHDGYDSASGLDYDAVDNYAFAWSGDESDTVMQYIAVSNGFGVFDRDNMARYQFAGYLNWANAIEGNMAGIELSSGQQRNLDRADTVARRAQKEFRSWDYLAAADHARQAWSLVTTVADQAGIDTALPSPSRAKLSTTALVPHEVDPVRPPVN